MNLLKVTFLGLALGAASLTVFAQAAASTAPSTPTQDAQVKAYVDMMRKDMRNDSNAVVDQAMGLDPAQKAKFWAVYDGYQTEMKGLWDQRLANIKKYADNYDTMTDATADQLATNALNIEAQQTAIRKKYYPQMKAALGAKVAARWLQVENMIGQLVGLQVNSQIPLVP